MSCYQIVLYTYLVGWRIVFENVPDNFWMWVWHFDLRRRGRWIWLAALSGNFVCNLLCDFPTLGWLLLQFLITLMKQFYWFPINFFGNNFLCASLSGFRFDSLQFDFSSLWTRSDFSTSITLSIWILGWYFDTA